MSNKSRQPKTEKAAGNPNKGQPASVISQVKNTGNRLQGKELTDGKMTWGDES